MQDQRQGTLQESRQAKVVTAQGLDPRQALLVLHRGRIALRLPWALCNKGSPATLRRPPLRAGNRMIRGNASVVQPG